MNKHICILVLVLVSLVAQAQIEQNYKPIQYTGNIPGAFIENINDKTDAEIGDDDDLTPQQKKEYYAVRNYLLRDLLLSGHVLFNDTITAYLNGITDHLLRDDPKLRSEIKIYVTKLSTPNAFTLSDGSIFVNLGLLELIENEAQLAYIISHEIMHYVHKHSLRQYKYENGDGEETEDEDEDLFQDEYSSTMLRSLRFSRDNELEADREGLVLYLKAGYSAKEALAALNLLRKADELHFTDTLALNIIFNSDSFHVDSSYNKIPVRASRDKIKNVSTSVTNNDTSDIAQADSLETLAPDTAVIKRDSAAVVVLDSVAVEKIKPLPIDDVILLDTIETVKIDSSISNADGKIVIERVRRIVDTTLLVIGADTLEILSLDLDDDEDEYSTHPSIKKRLHQIHTLLSETDTTGKTRLNSASFDVINTYSVFELVKKYYQNGAYLLSLYECYQLQRIYPQNMYLKEMICKNLFWLSYYRDITFDDDQSYNYVYNTDSSSFITFSDYLTDMSDKRFQRLAQSYIEQQYRENKNNEEITILYARMLKLIGKDDEANDVFQYFVDTFAGSPHYTFAKKQLN